MHLDADQLLKLSLDLLEADELPAVQAHLASCPECRSKLAQWDGDVKLLGSLRVSGDPIPMPRRRAVWIIESPFLRAAAVLIIVIGIGSLSVSSTLRPPAHVIPDTVAVRPLPDSVLHAVIDGTEVRLF